VPPPARDRLVVTPDGFDVERHPDEHRARPGVGIADRGQPVGVDVQGHGGTFSNRPRLPRASARSIQLRNGVTSVSRDVAMAAEHKGENRPGLRWIALISRPRFGPANQGNMGCLRWLMPTCQRDRHG